MALNYSRREFLGRSLAAGAGAAALHLVPASRALGLVTPPLHPLTQSHDPAVLLEWMPVVYDAVRRERYTPPNAARTYAYCGVAAYESVVGGMPRFRSLGLQLNDLPRLPAAAHNRRYDWPTCANAAMASVAAALFTGRAGSLNEFGALEADFRDRRLAAVNDPAVINRSEAHGRAIAETLKGWIERDGWIDIQGLPFTPPVGPGLWVRTPPNFGTSIEPYWEKVRPFALSPVDACAPPPPVPFSTDPGSAFYAEAKATYDAGLALTDHQRDTALRWRDNPDGTTGLPSGHWTLIVTILIRDLGYDLARAAELLALHGIAVADGFTSCWTEKYRTNLLRPVTYIKAYIDPAWNSFVNSPAFPEYTSGHSVGSGAAAATLTALVGATPFTDDTGMPNGFAPRSYANVWEAAQEAAISRLYGGIHYPMGIHAGVDQGVRVAEKVMAKIKTRK